MSRTYKLTMNKVEQFKWNLMEQERSEATIEKYIRDINAFFEWLVSYRITCNNGNQRTLINP